MFKPKTERIEKIAARQKHRVAECENLLSGKVNMYIDYANVRPWANKLEWHIDLKRLKQFLDSFDNISSVKIYQGTLQPDIESRKNIEMLGAYGYDVKTKKVKIMQLSIDTSSISIDSAVLLENFIRRCLLRKYSLETIGYLNERFKEMNNAGIYFIKDLKCNFDVEIGRDMLLDFAGDGIDTYVLWSGDSDFADPLEQLLDDDKKVILFATARKISKELNALREKGLLIFDIQKIRNFICWKKEIETEIMSTL